MTRARQIVARNWRLALRCRSCGRDYVPSRGDLDAGPALYGRCPACRIESGTASGAPCRGCGRPLRGPRTLCLNCLGGVAL